MKYLSILFKPLFAVFLFVLFFLCLQPSQSFAAPLYPFTNDQQINENIDAIRGSKGEIINSTGITFMNLRNQVAGANSMMWCTNINSQIDWKEPYNSPHNKLVIADAAEECQQTAIGQTGMAIAAIYQNQPASLAWYTRDVLANAGLAPKAAYAQGIGFSGLLPILPLWKTFRDVSYVILVFVMVVIGFMVIFRMKLDPKTVISVQAALPKIIITLLLITFSYAIAGFLIDLMYLSIGVIVALLGTAFKEGGGAVYPGTDPGDIDNYQQIFMTADSGDLFNSVFAFGLTPAAFMNFFGGSFGNVITGFLGLGAGAAIGTSIGSGAVAAGGATAAGIFGIPYFLAGMGGMVGIILLIVLLGLLFTFIRLLFLLINAYFQILIGVILAPIFLLPEAIPGRSAFTQWFLNLVANLSVFPATVAIIYLSWIFTSISWKGALWGPPFVGFPFSGSGASGNEFGNPFAVIFGLSIIFLAPNLVASIKKVFHPKPSLPITAGTALSPLTGAVGSTMGTVQQFYYPMQIMREAGTFKTFIGNALGGGGSKGKPPGG